MLLLKEGHVKFYKPEGVFYNPHMALSRSLSSLAVGAIEEELGILDGMSATGIRGLRYAKENDNVGKIAFVDNNKTAVEIVKKNMEMNGISGKAILQDINAFLFSTRDFNFIELDPFGSPVPFLYFAIRALRGKREAYLSVTATDTAVLCGAHSKACRKYYHAKPLRQYFCHETGLRILIAYIAKIAHEFNFGIKPLLSFYYRHQMKTIIALERGAKKAEANFSSLGFVSFCPKCLNIEFGEIAEKRCPFCKARMDYGGELWLSQLSDPHLIEKMIKLNEERDYENKSLVSKYLQLILEEEKINLPY